MPPAAGRRYFHAVLRSGKVSPFIRARRVTASFLNPLRRYYRSLLPLMPMALEHFDLRGYDLVISSESGPAKGVHHGIRNAPRMLLPHSDAVFVGLVSRRICTNGRGRE